MRGWRYRERKRFSDVFYLTRYVLYNRKQSKSRERALSGRSHIKIDQSDVLSFNVAGGANRHSCQAGVNKLVFAETFLLKLGEDYYWNITIDDQTIISRVPNVLVVRGAQGIYRAHEPGHALPPLVCPYARWAAMSRIGACVSALYKQFEVNSSLWLALKNPEKSLNPSSLLHPRPPRRQEHRNPVWRSYRLDELLILEPVVQHSVYLL